MQVSGLELFGDIFAEHDENGIFHTGQISHLEILGTITKLRIEVPSVAVR